MTRLIEEEEAFKVLSAYYKHSTPVQDSALHDALSRVPTAEPVRRGEWTVTPIYIKCSECGESFMLIPQNHCPNCGARMKEE